MIRRLAAVSCSALLVAMVVPALASPGAASSVAVTPRTLVSIAGHRTSEFTTAVDPRDTAHLVAAGMDWDGPNGTVSCRSFVSRDGGASWTAGGAVPEFTDARQHVDPWVAMAPDGSATMTCIGMTVTATGLDRQLLFSRSSDGGTSWTAAVRVPGTGATATKDSILAARDGRLLVCFGASALSVVGSRDGGRHWGPVHVFTGMNATCNGMAQAPNGAIVLNFQGDGAGAPVTSFGTLVTSDGGSSWSPPSVGGVTGSAPSQPPFPQAAAPSLAVSPTSGAVVLAAQRYVSSAVPSAARAEALLVRSAKAGAAYKPITVPVFPSKACAGCNQVHPTVAYDRQGQLALQVTLSDDQSLVRETWLSISRDDGAHWLAPVLLGGTDQTDSYLSPSDLAPSATGAAAGATGSGDAPGTALGLAVTAIWPYFHRDGGEYFGLVAASRGFVPMWVDHYGDGRNAIWSRIVTVR